MRKQVQNNSLHKGKRLSESNTEDDKHAPPLPFSQKFKREKLDKEFLLRDLEATPHQYFFYRDIGTNAIICQVPQGNLDK